MALVALVAAPTWAANGKRRLAQDPALSIRYEETPCLGRCPSFAVTLSPDGSALFAGREFTALIGARRLRLPVASVRALWAVLAPLRPAAGVRAYIPFNSCRGTRLPVTDLPSVRIRWEGPHRTRQGLDYYEGCGIAEVEARLRRARQLLPIDGLVGRR